ncbi:hypothetical protein N431DRAFT_481460 [Stipitochalara longipes BDJ]|nr:hypothetical protein N431DRAFT_481460 [Stipitochalara longipes BDJ]
MDPLTALALASNIVGFIDFASKLISQGHEIYKSTSGALQENVDIEILANDLSLHVKRLKQGNTITAVTFQEQQLQSLASKCAILADDILLSLNKLKVNVNAKFKSFNSAGKALRTAWGKKDLEEKMAKLESFRSQLQFSILVSLKEDIDLVLIQQSEQFDRLEDKVQQLVLFLIQNRNVFTQELDSQTTMIDTLHQTTEANIKKHIDHNQAQVMQALTFQQLQEDRRKEDAILQHLRFPTLDVRYEEIDPAYAKTFDWIFEGFASPDSNCFTDWLEGKNKGESLYWIYGKAGSGKSTLMKYIYDDPRTKSKLFQWTDGQALTMASFFFWISGNADQCSQTGLLRSLLYYLLSQHRHLIRVVFSDFWETLNVSTVLRAWTLLYASKALRDLLTRDLGKVILFIDGLDEYHGDHGNHLSSESPEYYREIVDLIKSLSSPDVKICFSGRPLVIFHNHFDTRPKLRLQDLTYKDISTYVKDKLDNDDAMRVLRLDYDWDPSSLISSIVEQAEGVFLWVVLVVRSLLNGIENSDDIQDLQNRLKFCPSNMMALYRYMLQQIQPSYLAEGCKIFAMADTAFTMTQQQKDKGLLSRGHCEKLCMIGVWFGLQCPETASQRPKHLSNEAEIVRAVREVDRKLKTRCAGLLEAGHSMPTQDWKNRSWYERDNVLMEAKYGNRRVQYIHRSAKEFLDLETTKSLLEASITSGYNPKIAMLWSTIQRISIYEVEPRRPLVDRAPKNDLLCLADSALLLAQGLQDEGEARHIQLLDQVDTNMQLKQHVREVSWVSEAMHKIYEYHARYGGISHEPPNEADPVSETESPGETEFLETVYLDPQFKDDFLSLTVKYGLSDYVESKVLENRLVVKQKVGRPYLDYALASHNDKSVDVNPRMVEFLLRAGADPNEYCPTDYSLAEREESIDGRHSGFGYDAWTPWRSALESVLWTAAGNRKWQSKTLNPQQGRNWIQVLKSLLAKGADVSIDTWVMFKINPDISYSVDEVIFTVFAESFPEDAVELVAMVNELARAQGHQLLMRIELPLEEK